MGFFGDIVDGIGDAIDSVTDVVSDVVDDVVDIVEDVGKDIITIGTGIATGNPALIIQGAGALIGVEDAVRSESGASTGGAQAVIIDVESLITEPVNQVLDRIFDEVIGLTESTQGELADKAKNVINAIRDVAIDAVKDALKAQTDAAVIAAQAQADLTNAIRAEVIDTGLDLSDIAATVGAALARQVEATVDLQTVTADAITEQSLQSIAAARDAQAEVSLQAADLIEAQVVGTRSLAGAIEESGTKQAGTIAQLGVSLNDGLIANTRAWLNSFGKDFWRGTGGMLEPEVEADTDKVASLIERLSEGGLCVGDSPEDLGKLLDEMLPENAILRWVAAMVIGAFTWLSVGSGITAAQAQTILQAFARRCPYRVLSPADAITAYQRGQITREEMEYAITSEGYSSADAQTLWISSLAVPAELDLLGMVLRGIISEAEYRGAMRARGYDEGWTERMLQSARLLPPVQDLISMAVREAFSPAAIQEFGLEEDFPEEFAFWAGQQGVSEDWAKKYWAAHWALPSIQMGYQMLHRDIIDGDQLKALMKALDIVPAWRDNLIEMSYNPYTRVDVRRMHKMGILDEDQVLRAYKDLGYDEEKAANLTRFTIELNRPAPTKEADEAKTLTRSSVLGFYEDGLLDRGEAQRLLVGEGYSEDLADLFIEAVDMQVERRERQEQIELILNRVRSDELTYDEAESELARIGLTAAEQTRAMNKLLRTEQSQVKLPSKGELKAMLLNGIIDEERYLSVLQRQGYSQTWASRFLALVTGGPASAATQV